MNSHKVNRHAFFKLFSTFKHLFLFTYFWPHRAAYRILAPLAGTESGPSVKAQSPNH